MTEFFRQLKTFVLVKTKFLRIVFTGPLGKGGNSRFSQKNWLRVDLEKMRNLVKREFAQSVGFLDQDLE